MVLPKKPVRNRSEFSYKTDAQTPLASVFAYLNGKLSRSFTPREGKQRAIDALLAFWKPYALKANGAEPENVRDAAISSAEALHRQLQRICADFNVESPCSSTESPDFSDLFAALTSRLQQVEPGSDQTFQAQAELQSPRNNHVEPLPEMIFVNDEELLGDLI
jgi:hypothetical protein